MASLCFTSSVKKVFAGGEASAAVTSKGEVYLWGSNFYGNISAFGSEESPTDSVLVPTLLNSEQLAGKTIVHIALGLAHSLFLTDEGLVFSCGAGRSGKLGQGSTENFPNTPTQVKGLKHIKQVACSDLHSASCTSKVLYTWGEGYNGKLGHGIVSELDRSCKNLNVPKEVAFGGSIQKVGCGNKYTLILDKQKQLHIAGNLDKKKVWHKDDFVL